ncbi:MAG: ATP-binding protein [Ginsengibacter sp.]
MGIIADIEEQEKRFSGLWIGLLICKEIIQKHRGKIWAESEPGKGSTFYFICLFFLKENNMYRHQMLYYALLNYNNIC